MRLRTAPLVLSVLLLLPVAPASAAEPDVVTVPAASTAPATEPPAASAAVVPELEPVPSQSADPIDPPDPVLPVEPAESLAPVEAPSPAESPSPAVTPTPIASAAPDVQPLSTVGRYIVILDEGAKATTVRDRHATRFGLRTDRLFQQALQGFAGRLTPGQVTALRRDPDVAAVVPDEIVEVASQLLPTGVSRIGGKSSTVARIDGVDQRVNADVAVIDTGIDPIHPDLNVVGGYNCTTSNRSLWRDLQGHGTHVAGTIGAIDNGTGVVGVAPGVRLWAVRILNDEGFGYLSWYVCGLDWIAAQRDPNDPSRPLIEAVNMSVAKWGTDGGNCGLTTNDVLHQAICRVANAGTTVVAAAANDAGSAAARVPAAYNEVITVSALADTDGKSGALGGNRCLSWGGYDKDDTFADFSNYGGDVDLIAPGKCIWSTLPGNRYGYSSGTSMAAPAVAGAAALYLASRPWATPDHVKAALQYLGSSSWLTATDPDGKPERLLSVSRMGPAGTFAVDLTPPPSLGELGGTIVMPVEIDRSANHFETLKLTHAVPAGLTATLDRTVLSGFTDDTTTLTVIVPPFTPAGRYSVTVRADETGRTHEASVDVVVENDAPTASAPGAAPLHKAAVSGLTVPMAISWAQATDPTSAIAGYELQHSADGGEWSPAQSFDAATRMTIRWLPINQGHVLRVRAQDRAGNWSDWAEAPAIRLGLLDNRSSAMKWSTGWAHFATTYAFNGTVHRTARTGSSVKATVTGHTVAVVAPLGPRYGWVKVYVNNTYMGQVSLFSTIGASRKIVWFRTFDTDGPKVVELRAVRTTARFRVDVDAILTVR